MQHASMRVLIVDDETVIRRSVSELLAAEGYDVYESRDGVDVVPLAAEKSPDLVVLDVRMPVVDGFQALRELRTDHRTEHIPVLMLSSVNDYELGTEYDEARIGQHTGVRAPEAFVEKPFITADLLRRVACVVEN
ncbi:MAG: response regulator [Candidatus Hydrogenedens sp.]|nr:response regulator [Candidatus Hydrogenedens sp.]